MTRYWESHHSIWPRWPTNASFMTVNKSSLSFQVVVICHLVWKTSESQIPWCAPRHITTSTADQVVGDWTGAGQVGTVGPGAQRDETGVSGCRWILAPLPECHVSLLREDRIPCNGWRRIIFRTAGMDTNLYLTEKKAELRLAGKRL